MPVFYEGIEPFLDVKMATECGNGVDQGNKNIEGRSCKTLKPGCLNIHGADVRGTELNRREEATIRFEPERESTKS